MRSFRDQQVHDYLTPPQTPPALVAWWHRHEPDYGWHVSVGSAVRLVVPVEAVVWEGETVVDAHGTIPSGTRGTVLQVRGATPDAEDGELLVACQWADAGRPRHAIAYLNHECWITPHEEA